MVQPLTAWLIVIVAVSLSGVTWLISAPIVSTFYSATASMLPEEAAGAAMTMRIEFMIMPILIDCLLAVWAFLVTTRRQPVVQGGYY